MSSLYLYLSISIKIDLISYHCIRSIIGAGLFLRDCKGAVACAGLGEGGRTHWSGNWSKSWPPEPKFVLVIILSKSKTPCVQVFFSFCATRLFFRQKWGWGRKEGTGRPIKGSHPSTLMSLCSGLLAESLIWNYIIQLTSALRYIHAAGQLSYHGSDNKIR